MSLYRSWRVVMIHRAKATRHAWSPGGCGQKGMPFGILQDHCRQRSRWEFSRLFGRLAPPYAMLTMFRRKMYPGSSPSMRVRIPLVLAAVVALVGTSTPAEGDPLRLILPTRNDALLGGAGPSFYQYTHRTFEGRRSKPWQGGQYGFVRNPLRTAEGIIYTKFHEGVDIRPVYRDHRGEPADTVVSIDDGYVVYVNNYERQSSYGKYVVVEHWWGGSPFYSLYAHLNSVTVRRGQRIRQGEPIGKLGYTGRGIDRERAHLHFEINMLLNRNFG